MTEYTLESGEKYMVDKWCKQIQKLTFNGQDGKEYHPSTNYKLVKITIDDVKYLFKYKKFPLKVENQIKKIFDDGKNKYFFRVSQRSPKDAWKKELKAKKSDPPERKLELELERKSKLYVGTLEEIYCLIKKSERVQEDFDLFVSQSKVKFLHLVFQDWRPSDGVEYRLFIKSNKLIGVCLYKPEFYQKNITIPIGNIINFSNWFLSKKFIKKNYQNMILDIFVDNKTSNIFFIEINPFEDYVDPFSFTWDEINQTTELILKL
jgi:hypothetical protein